MTQKHYVGKNKLELVEPALRNFVREQFDSAVKEIENSKEFAKHMQDALSSKEYHDFMDSLDETLLDDVVAAVDSMIDYLYRGKSDDEFNYFVRACIYSTGILHTAPFYIKYTDDIFTEENWKELLYDTLEKSIDQRIENIQKDYARQKMNMYSHDWMPHNLWEEFQAVLAVLECGTIEELKQQVLNNIDFKAFAIRK